MTSAGHANDFAQTSAWLARIAIAMISAVCALLIALGGAVVWWVSV